VRISLRHIVMCTVALSSTLQHTPQAEARDAADTRLTIRSYDGFGVAATDMALARVTVREVLEAARLDTRWRDCRMARGNPVTTDDACDDPLGGSELMIRIVAAPKSASDRDVLGFAYVDAGSRRATLGTVFADRMAAVARTLGVKGGTLLGRAIAHEVGHLLLGTTRHPAGGLMRDRWSRRDVGAEDWLFADGESATMRSTLAGRRDTIPTSLAQLNAVTERPGE
jgi:hypothetical protein